MIRAIKIIWLCIIGMAGFFRCSQQPLIAGNSSSETTNGYVVGSLVKTDGSPAMHAEVRLIPDNFNPVKDGPVPDSLIVTTDDAGDFWFRVSGGGAFNIEGVQQSSGDRVLITGILVGKGDTVTVARKTIQKPGALEIFLPSMAANEQGYLYCPGTTFWALIANRSAGIDSVPAGSIPALCYVNTTDTALNRSIKTNFTVMAASTAVITETNAWVFSKKLHINTTSSGAAVGGNVYSFPLLVRLSTGNVVFSQAKSRGEDVRFAKADGSPLPFDVERWDPVTQQAEIWVKVDTIYGNDSTHYITMLWGDSSATGSSKGAAVFDTANGFTAVWHLNAGCSDITAAKHDGTNVGVTDTAGIIGGAKKFNGSGYVQVQGLLGAPQSVTLSAWVHLDSTITFSQDIVSLGDAVALRADREAAPYYGTEGFYCSKVSATDTVFVFTSTGAFISKTGWRYLTYTVDGARHVQSMYIDGIFLCSTNDINPINYSGLGTNTFLGAHGNKKTASYALGCIDEARVCRVARSADWIKLCYMNQKQQDALVRW
jgi:hypothetical protein